MKRQNRKSLEDSHGLRRLKYCLLFGTWPYLPAHFYYYKKLNACLIEEDHFQANAYHKKFREADQLMRYGQKLSISQVDIIQKLEKTCSKKVSIEALVTGRFWRYLDGSLNFKPRQEFLIASLYTLLFTLSSLFFVGLTSDLISLDVPLWLKACVIIFSAATIGMPLTLLAFFSVVPTYHFLRIKDKIQKIEAARKLEVKEHSKRAKITHLDN